MADERNKYQLIGTADDGASGDLLEGLGTRESRQRLQALVSEWLRMENLVVLTGAGTSVSSGGLTLNQLEDAVLKTVRALPQRPARTSDLLDARLSPDGEDAGPSKLSFEDWLSHLASARFVTSLPGSPIESVRWKEVPDVPSEADLQWLLRAIRAAIFAECALTLSNPVDATPKSKCLPPHLAFLAKLLARDSNLGRAHLFTLNYDTLFEQALETLSVQYFDGFSGRADARFDPSVYGLDIYYPGDVSEGRVRRFDRFLHLYKLHGSIHWQVQNDTLRARHPDLRRFQDYPGFPITEKAARLTELAQGLPSIGILPTANKFVQTLTMPYAHLFRALHIRLSTPQTFLLVLGYGFGDAHVNRVLETALLNPSLVMLVVEPDPESGTIDRIRRYKHLGRRAFVLTSTEAAHQENPFSIATFEDFALEVLPDVQWLRDFLKLRRFEGQIQSADAAALKPGGEPQDWTEP